ncbi:MULTISPECIES: amidohydrolase family protein [unclassified Blastococcus]
MSSVLRDIPIIDTDTHVVEPPDLWTSRVPARLKDQVPSVRWMADRQEEVWVLGDSVLSGVGAAAMAGWHEHPPFHPRTWAEADPATWDAGRRAAMMDGYGIRSQILYPNVAVFNAGTLVGLHDPEAQLACVQAYNDFLVDWSGEAPGRLVPVATLPFWDLQLTLAEIERVAAMGHRGIVFTQDPTAFGLPMLTDRYWDPMWASAQEKGLPVNFHIASGEVDLNGFGHPDNGIHANYAMMGVSFFMGNAKTVSQLICGGICHRFPDLKFVSVESGIGWIPFALAGLDWQWLNCGVHKEHPEYDLLPSEYFKRQIYGCFWFERDTALSAIEQLGPDNVLFETDFPHPTSLSPGPASTAERPDDFLRNHFAGLDETVLRKVLHDNAARLYSLP